MARLLLLLASLFVSALALCPADFQLIRNGQCQRKTLSAVNMWSGNGPTESIQNCAQYGAVPVTIFNQEDHDFWIGVSKQDKKQGSENGNIILAIYCDPATNHWKWVDGRNMSTAWIPTTVDNAIHEACDYAPGRWGEIPMWIIDPIKNSWERMYDYSAMDNWCIIPPAPQPAYDPDCTNFSDDADDGICYQVGQSSETLAEATTICRSFGASVASVHNDRENTFIRRLAIGKGLINGMLLGGSFTSNSNAFKWSDGSMWDYDNFAPGFPQEGFGECLGMETNNVGGQWINIDCSLELPFACVRPTGSSSPACDGTARKEEEIIYSPGFPNDASIPCDFTLTAAPGMLVEVEILLLEANSCCDQLVLYEGSARGNQIAVLTGEISNSTTFRTTSQNVMRASWQPQGGVNVKGMMITFRSVPKQ